MTKTDQLTMSASQQALLALGAIGFAGYLVSSTMTTLLNNDIGAFDSNYQAVPSELEFNNNSLQALVDYAESTDTPIEFVNSATPIANGLQIGSDVVLMPIIEEYDSNPTFGQSFRVSAVGFAARNQRIELDQIQLLNQLEQHAIQESARARAVLAETGISLGSLTGINTQAAVLPEFITYNVSQDPEFGARVAQVAGRIAENQRLMEILTSAPLAAPIARAVRRTSGYGVRHDPFTGDARFHAGVDIAAPMNTSVQVTAAGTIRFAGWKDGYGNCIDVDHGNGFMTRYGHLNRIDVQVGQRVHVGHEIGLLGSTGRSTGPHLHYEVWYRGQVMDPRNFMSAGAHIHNREI